MSDAPRRLQALDAVAYAITLTAVIFVATTAVSLAAGAGLVGTKYALFFIGFGLFGYATFRLRPKSAWKREGSQSGGGGPITGSIAPSSIPDTIAETSLPRSSQSSDGETRFQAMSTALLPDEWVLPPEARLSAPAKLFLASIAVLATSWALESVFGVGM
jgi:hypothetical protein